VEVKLRAHAAAAWLTDDDGGQWSALEGAVPVCSPQAAMRLRCRNCSAVLSEPITAAFLLPSPGWRELADEWFCGACCGNGQDAGEVLSPSPYYSDEQVANQSVWGFGWKMSSRGRVVMYADFLLQDRSPYRNLHARRERLDVVHCSRAIFCRPAPNPNRPIRNFCIDVRGLISERGSVRVSGRANTPSWCTGDGSRADSGTPPAASR
jgi:hypothetical protein